MLPRHGIPAPAQGINLDDEQKAVVGQVIPWTMAFLG
jgi:multicomponent K+:H+ antiporter subunit D